MYCPRRWLVIKKFPFLKLFKSWLLYMIWWTEIFLSSSVSNIVCNLFSDSNSIYTNRLWISSISFHIYCCFYYIHVYIKVWSRTLICFLCWCFFLSSFVCFGYYFCSQYFLHENKFFGFNSRYDHEWLDFTKSPLLIWNLYIKNIFGCIITLIHWFFILMKFMCWRETERIESGSFTQRNRSCRILCSWWWKWLICIKINLHISLINLSAMSRDDTNRLIITLTTSKI